MKTKPEIVNWRLFKWERCEPKYPAGDRRNREEPYWEGRYKNYGATIIHYSNRVGLEYTWEISWPVPGAFDRIVRSHGCANETTAMLMADQWLYLRLNPTE